MKLRPEFFQPGATHWNPNEGPDWFSNVSGRWRFYKSHTQGWRVPRGLELAECAFIPVEDLHKIEWDGEGVPPVNRLCRLHMGDVDRGLVIITHVGESVFCYLDEEDQEHSEALRHAKFFPINIERDKAIEEIKTLIKNVAYQPYRTEKISAILYDAGYRKTRKRATRKQDKKGSGK
jgi:hypothetical protein